MHFVELSKIDGKTDNYLLAVASQIEKLVAFHYCISLWTENIWVWVELDWQHK